MKKYAGKSALITGGSSGIGLELAKQLTAAGARVTILARDPQKLETACAEIQAASQPTELQVCTIQADVSDAEGVMNALASLEAPDLLFNAAGIAHPGLFMEMDLDIFRQMMEVNYFGTINVIKALLPRMVRKETGHIINFSSVAGFLGIYGYSAYGPSKFAIRGLSDVLRAELATHHIQVSIVFPGDTETPQLVYENQHKPAVLRILDESNKVMSAQEVARIILRKVSKGSYVITPGFDSSFYFYLNNLLGNLSYRVMDFMLMLAHNRLRSTKDQHTQ